MKQYNTVELETVINEALEDMGLTTDEIDMSLFKRWANDIFQEITVPQQYTQKVALFETDKMGKVRLPPDFRIINQVAYRLKNDKNHCSRKETVVQWVQEMWGEDCHLEINMYCDKCKNKSCSCDKNLPIVDVDYMWERSHPEYSRAKTSMSVAKNITEDLENINLTDKFKLMAYRGPNNGMFRLRYHVDNCENLSCIGCAYGYAITSDTLDTDCPPQTEILLSYMGMKTDENGDPLLYDEPNTLEAIKKGILSKHFAIKMLQASEPATVNKYKYFYESFKMESDVAIGRAKSKLDIPSPQELRKFLSEVWTNRIRFRGAVNPLVRKHINKLY
jgi:hypothetical protein